MDKRLQELAGIRSKEPKYKVIFYDYHDTEYPTKEVFNPREEAINFAESGMWEEDIEYMKDGEDYTGVRNRYYSKEYDESFYSYEIKEI